MNLHSPISVLVPALEICDVSNLSSLSLSHVCTDKIAGKLKHFLPKWAKLTSDNTILDCAAHYQIDFIDNVHPFQHTVPNQISFSETEQRVIDAEVSKLLEKGVREPCVPETGEFISTVFLRSKKDGSHRMMLKLNTTPAKAFTPPAEKKKGHKVVLRQKSKRVTGLYLKAPNPHSFAMESVKICHFEIFRVGHFALRTFCCFFLLYTC